ncbi:MAG: monovalent cation/H(+) antiporter subunit G [Pseudomonadota bacterium]
MIDILALFIKVVGVGFLLIATVGLLRFDDPFQRMHAATKAGTLGAGLVLIGTLVNKSSGDALLTGGMTLLFLILTIPVASHLLARAAYMSGAELAGVGKDNDALREVFTRPDRPIEAQSERVDYQALPDPSGAETEMGISAAHADPVLGEATEPSFISLKDVVAPERVRFAAIGEVAPNLARRAAGFADRANLPLTAVVAIDKGYIDSTENSAQTLRLIRDKVSHWLPDLRQLSESLNVPVDLVYEEGDAAALMAGVGDVREFLVLPTDGWADHDVGVATPYATKEPDGLLRVAGLHPGPTLYAVDEQKAGPVAVLFDGSYDVWRALDLALVEGLWEMTELRVYGYVDMLSRAEIEQRAGDAGVTVTFAEQDLVAPKSQMLPSRVVDDAVAVILPDLPRPLRTRWYGVFWQDKIAPDWRGDVLVWT